MTPDPIGLAGGINQYAYVQNNPINGVDPLGLHGFILFGRAPITFRPSPAWRPPINIRPPTPKPKVTPPPRIRPVFRPPPEIVRPQPKPWWYWLLRLFGRGEDVADACNLKPPSQLSAPAITEEEGFIMPYYPFLTSVPYT